MKRGFKFVNHFIFLIICILITSCYSTKKLVSKKKTEAIQFSIQQFNGTYKNQLLGFEQFGLWQLLNRGISFKSDTTSTINTAVKLKLVTKNKLEIQLLSNDKILNTLTLKGHVQNEYFSIHRKLILVPIPFLYIHRESKTLLGNDASGSLVVVHGFKDDGWNVIMAGGGGGGISNYNFERLKTE